MSVLLFYAVLILGVGLVAAAMVALPRVALQWALSAYVPAWLLVLISLAVSVGLLKLFNRSFPGMLWLTAFVFLFTIVDHVGQMWKVLDGTGRAILTVAVGIALLLLTATVRASGPMWPAALLMRLLALLR
ncbi:hypothetical protein SAMN06297144_2553 [Sphingomonas guangdongensis]|uniref:Uncharacterized protein n=1 Tax=Sphingomonas guangdongensis TaxID=1141890 RepID=A0A285QZZ8_9SPHN|nr:hypothetical protein [Sphingomonas guangdongensis]SOB87421.1 hypothetical protein SAMN06297144_2553 [Sphingomonas guangdongensis]